MQARNLVVAVDVGNTETSFGLFAAEAAADDEPLSSFTLTTAAHLTANEARLCVREALGFMAEDAGIPVPERFGAVLSCVVPCLTEPWREGLGRASGLRPLVVGPGLRSGMRLAYKDPAEIGPDRLADAVAVRTRYGAPAVAVDFGTTLNIEAVGADGSFRGGIIAPGLALGAKALRESAARLPEIELSVPDHAIGTTTADAMRAGLVLGELARADGLIDLVFEELGSAAPVAVTGSGAARLAPHLKHEAAADATLTLRGLHEIYLANPKLWERAATE
ncbi:MAG: type III pantothenate kinase [Atopobiaceae bacterium]